MEGKKLTGYPSIDKPWLKYYSEESLDAQMPACNLYDYIFQNNKDHLDDIALVYFGRRITYGTLFSGIDKATNAFLSLGVKAEDVVSFISVTTPELIYCVYALNRLGAVANMLDPRSSEETLITQISRAESRILVALDACAEKIEALSGRLSLEYTILLSAQRSMGFPIKQLYSLKTAKEKKTASDSVIRWESFVGSMLRKCPVSGNTSASAPAMIWYTGGTTGEAKGVLLSNLNVNSVAVQYRMVASGQPRQQNWLTVSAPFIAYSFICGLHMPLACGMICCIELYDPESIAEAIVKKKYNHVAVTPIVWENMIRNPKIQNKDLSFLVAPTSGADYMSPKLEQEINTFFASHHCQWKICQGYGMTEVGSGVATCLSNDHNKSGSVGIPLPSTIISTFDIDSDRELPIGEIGEVCVCGPSVMCGYYKNSEATNMVVKQHKDGRKWMHTGDIGRIDEDGNLFITGRIKRMITRFDGFKVFPAAVEEKILSHPAIHKCSVVGKTDPRSESGQLPVAFLVIPEPKNKENVLAEVIEDCKKVLPEYAQPVEYFFVDEFPLTPAGKIDYRALEKEAEEL